jgi:hypothetical protein
MKTADFKRTMNDGADEGTTDYSQKKSSTTKHTKHTKKGGEPTVPSDELISIHHSRTNDGMPRELQLLPAVPCRLSCVSRVSWFRALRGLHECRMKTAVFKRTMNDGADEGFPQISRRLATTKKADRKITDRKIFLSVIFCQRIVISGHRMRGACIHRCRRSPLRNQPLRTAILTGRGRGAGATKSPGNRHRKQKNGIDWGQGRRETGHKRLQGAQLTG